MLTNSDGTRTALAKTLAIIAMHSPFGADLGRRADVDLLVAAGLARYDVTQRLAFITAEGRQAIANI